MIARRRLLTQLFPICAALPAILTGCGWEPLYADQQTTAGSAELRAIKVNPITERIGQNLETGLRESLNPGHVPTKSLYLLKVTLTQSLQDLGIQSQGLGTRGEVHIQANYSLVEISTGKILQNAGIHSNDSFDIQANGYSTVVAEDDAKTRCVEDLRREIVARLTMFMQNGKPVT
jgi:LPS-assembly lipoprotein